MPQEHRRRRGSCGSPFQRHERLREVPTGACGGIAWRLRAGRFPAASSTQAPAPGRLGFGDDSVEVGILSGSSFAGQQLVIAQAGEKPRREKK